MIALGKIVAGLLFSLLVVVHVPSAAAQDEDLNLVLEEQLSGLGQITDIQNAGDSRLFVVTKDGRIQIIDFSRPNATLLETPFLDLSDQVKDSGEQGLLGLAFHPDYATNGHFFVNYIYDDKSAEEPLPGNGMDTRISRFSTAAGTPNIADKNSELIIATIPQPFSNHNGGQLQFGPTDGFLYIGLGDGGSGNDPADRALDLTTLLGKMLRVDINDMDEGAVVNEANPRWNVPADNPFVGSTTGARAEIWLVGLRNPWRFSFDRLTNDLWIGDVGQSAREEISFLAAESTTGGENFGWRACEGTRLNIAGSLPGGCSCGDDSCFVPPVIEYGRLSGTSVTGGFVYRGVEYDSQLGGTYLFADFGSNTIWGAREEGGTWVNMYKEVSLISSPSTFGQDVNGEVYIGSLGGGLYRVTLGMSDSNGSVGFGYIVTQALVIVLTTIFDVFSRIFNFFFGWI